MGFYSSNNTKFKKYKVARKAEESYYDDQQDELDELLAEKRGDVAMIDRYSRLAKQLVNSFGDQVMTPSAQLKNTGTKAATDYLRDIIKSGSLSKWFDNIKTLDTKGLSKKAKLIVNDIKNENTRSRIVEAVNSSLSESTNPTEEAENIVIQAVAGGDKTTLDEINQKIETRQNRSSSDESITTEMTELTWSNINSEDSAKTLLNSNKNKMTREEILGILRFLVKDRGLKQFQNLLDRGASGKEGFNKWKGKVFEAIRNDQASNDLMLN